MPLLHNQGVDVAMHLEFLVEEPSAEAALANLLPKIVGDSTSYRIHPFQGKTDLLAQLPNRLNGYRPWIPDDWRIIVLVDQDAANCRTLKGELEQIAQQAGLSTKSQPSPDGRFRVLNRLAVEELEAWFFGDIPALHRAYPRISANLHQREAYRTPDIIRGGTWEALERLLLKAGYYVGHMPKIEVAQQVSSLMDPVANRSRSFQVFREGVRACLD
jgi:hypothetical protein